MGHLGTPHHGNRFPCELSGLALPLRLARHIAASKAPQSKTKVRIDHTHQPQQGTRTNPHHWASFPSTATPLKTVDDRIGDRIENRIENRIEDCLTPLY
jgi:hypothetical protein